jgi:hypothetical protein
MSTKKNNPVSVETDEQLSETQIERHEQRSGDLRVSSSRIRSVQFMGDTDILNLSLQNRISSSQVHIALDRAGLFITSLDVRCSDMDFVPMTNVKRIRFFRDEN